MHDVHHFQSMPLPDLEIRFVVGRSHFEHAGSERHVDMRVADDRNLRPGERTHRVLADEASITRIIRMHRDGSVAHQRLRPRRGDLEKRAGFLRHLVAHDVKFALGGLHDDFLVAQRGLRHRAPVDHALAAVDEPLGVEFDENFLHLAGIIPVHGEALAVPIARATQALELFDDDAAVFFLPRPDALEKFLASQITARFAFLFAQLPLDHRLCGDAGMVGSRQPEDFASGLPRAAREDVLQGVVEHVAKRKHAGHVGWWNDDGKSGLGRGGIRGKAAGLEPLGIPFLLHRTRFVSFGNFRHRTGHHSEAGAPCKSLSRFRDAGAGPSR